MIRINVDAEIRAKLQNPRENIEICDDDGQVLATFRRSTPLTDPENWEPLTPEVTEEELERLRNSDEPRYTTQEVLDYLHGIK
jgi:hypothetical protein